VVQPGTFNPEPGTALNEQCRQPREAIGICSHQLGGVWAVPCVPADGEWVATDPKVCGSLLAPLAAFLRFLAVPRSRRWGRVVDVRTLPAT
jgi:hypothetical protein